MISPDSLSGTDKFENIYIHVPFCKTICHYCDFFKVEEAGANKSEYTDALKKERSLWAPHIAGKLQTVFIGGGTPSLLDPKELKKILESLGDLSDAEVTIEANPSDITHELLLRWQEAGVNRISLGVQSLNDEILQKLGRRHSADQARKAIEMATGVFKEVSGDFIYAVPEQSSQATANHIQEFIDQGVTHISAYSLTLKPGHLMFHDLPDDDLTGEHYLAIAETIQKNGWQQYEVSNYCRDKNISNHNYNYWRGGSYLGLGPSAHSYDGAHQRWFNFKNMQGYLGALEKNQAPVAKLEKLNNIDSLNEYLCLKLRTWEGIDFFDYKSRFQSDLAHKNNDLLRKMAAENLCVFDSKNLRLTPLGMLICDEIAARLAP